MSIRPPMTDVAMAESRTLAAQYDVALAAQYTANLAAMLATKRKEEVRENYTKGVSLTAAELLTLFPAALDAMGSVRTY